MTTVKKLLYTSMLTSRGAEFWLARGSSQWGRNYGRWEITREGIEVLLPHLHTGAIPTIAKREGTKILITLSDKVGVKIHSLFTIKLNGEGHRYPLVKGMAGEVIGSVERNDSMNELFKDILEKSKKKTAAERELSEKDEIYVAVYKAKAK